MADVCPNSMIKRLIQKIAQKMGYRISRIELSKSRTDPFAEMKLLCQEIEKPTLFDVGAHHGETARALRERFPTARIFSFEPFPQSFEALSRNTANDEGIQVFNYGLTDQPGTFAFHANSSPATNSLLPTDQLGSKTWGTGPLETQRIVEARFKTLDLVAAELGIQRIDVLKLDVQGAEHLVLKGALEACKSGRISVIYSEFIIQPTYIGQKRLDEALSAFYDAGFELHNIYNLSSRSDGKLRQIDAIFTKVQLTQQ